MQITVNIPDDFAAQVQSRGLTPESYVERLIAEQAGVPQISAPAHKLNLQEFNACLEELAQYSDKIPSLPAEAFSRESLYREHD